MISVLWSFDHVDLWFHDVVGKLSLVGISLIFAFLPKLTFKEVRWLHVVFYSSLIIACIMVFSIYIPQYEDITNRIGRGRPIPTPLDHVRFSMMNAYASLSAIFFFLSQVLVKKGLSPKNVGNVIFLFIGALFFVFTHILAVRSGIILLYSGIIISIIYIVLFKRAWKAGVFSLIIITILPILAYQSIPSFRNKVIYTRYDFEQTLSSNGVNYSDGDRIQSIKAGIDLWKNHKLIGYGAGDYKLAVEDYYANNLQEGRALLPHNQWIRTALAYGLIGCFLLLLSFLIPIFYNNGYKNLLLLLILQIFLLSFMVESNLERYYALVFFLIFIGLSTRASYQVKE